MGIKFRGVKKMLKEFSKNCSRATYGDWLIESKSMDNVFWRLYHKGNLVLQRIEGKTIDIEAEGFDEEARKMLHIIVKM